MTANPPSSASADTLSRGTARSAPGGHSLGAFQLGAFQLGALQLGALPLAASVRTVFLITTVLLVSAVAACSGDSSPPPADADAGSEIGTEGEVGPDTEVGPEAVAAQLRSAIQLAGEAPVTHALEDRMAHYQVPGVSVAVLDAGEIVWARGWGVADLETGAPVTPETLFQAASISKPVAALAAMSLVEEGAVELDGPVNAHLTGWQVPDNDFTADSAVTLRGLLSHTAGLTVWGFPGYRKDRPFADGQPLASNVQVLEGVGNTDSVRVYKVPGISWQYSGGGYTVMEQMLEDVTEQPFHEVLRERVLAPAGMTLSTYEQPLPEARWDEAARGHRGDGSEVEGEWHSYPEQAAAGLWTTPTELLTLSAHLRGILAGEVQDGVVSRTTLEAMLVPHRADEEGFSAYGLGFTIGDEGDDVTFGHGGSNEGFKAQWTVYRDGGQGVAIMTNGDQGGALAGEILRAVSAVYGWPGFKPEVRARRILTPDEAEAYAGRYAMEDQPEFVLVVSPGAGSLTLEALGQGSYTLHAVPDTADTFFDPSDGQSLVFERNDEGTVTGVMVPGQARFAKVAPEGG